MSSPSSSSDTLHSALKTDNEYVKARAMLTQHHRFWEHAMLIAIEGNIGVGKSTLLEQFKRERNRLREELREPTLELHVLTEPLDAWTSSQTAKAGLEVNIYIDHQHIHTLFIYIYISTVHTIFFTTIELLYTTTRICLLLPVPRATGLL